MHGPNAKLFAFWFNQIKGMLTHLTSLNFGKHSITPTGSIGKLLVLHACNLVSQFRTQWIGWSHSFRVGALNIIDIFESWSKQLRWYVDEY